MTWLDNLRQFNAALGHGRRMETFFACVALTMGLLLTKGFVVEDSSTFHALGHLVSRHLLFLPWLLYGLCGMLGVVRNVFALSHSRALRMAASTLGVVIWSWVTLLNLSKGDILSTMTAFSLWSAVFSFQALRTARLNLPIPGDPGRWT